MKRTTHLAHSSQPDARVPLYLQKTENQPFFKPARPFALPKVLVKTMMEGERKMVMISMDTNADPFFDQLIRFLNCNCQIAIEGSQSLEGAAPDADPDFLQKVDGVIAENLENEGFNCGELAKRLCCCEMQLYRKLKKLTALSPVNYIRSFRLRRSMAMLEQGKLTITEICYQVGFNSLEYFSRSFKKEFGLSPSAVRDAKLLE
jgi:AraC-like DNA-binding protein